MDRLQIVTVPQPLRLPSFAEDVAAGFVARPKKLNSKYFYDAVGSALFDAITLLPEYYLTRAETAILREWGWEIVRALGNPVEFVELGSGSAAKTRILIEEALREVLLTAPRRQGEPRRARRLKYVGVVASWVINDAQRT